MTDLMSAKGLVQFKTKKTHFLQKINYVFYILTGYSWGTLVT